jgi:hypothetical protein
MIGAGLPGAGCRVPGAGAGAGCRVRVPGAGAGAGCRVRGGCRVRVRGGCRVRVPGALMRGAAQIIVKRHMAHRCLQSRPRVVIMRSGSRVKGQGSRVMVKGSRVRSRVKGQGQGSGSRVKGQGSRVKVKGQGSKGIGCGCYINDNSAAAIPTYSCEIESRKR